MLDTFYRLPQHDRWQYSGAGLGLTLVKKQMDYLGGTINAAIADQQLIVNVELPQVVFPSR